MKFLIAPLVLVSALLGGCQLNNEDMKATIEACKNDPECMEIINEEIDNALGERGFYNYDDYSYELSEEEEAMWTVLEGLEDEFYSKIEDMTDEEVNELFGKDEYFFRKLTDEEESAFELVESLYEQIDWDKEFDFEDGEVSFIESGLGRKLTAEERTAVQLIETIYDEEEMYYENLTEIEWTEMELGRELSEDEKTSIEIVEGLYGYIDYENEMDYDFDTEVEFLEAVLSRTLTEEEKVAVEVVTGLYTEYEESFLNSLVEEYESVLGRTLTEEEKEALLFIDMDYMEVEFEKEYDDFDLTEEQ